MLHRITERTHPVNPVRNPRSNEMWLTEQQKRESEFSKVYGRLFK